MSGAKAVGKFHLSDTCCRGSEASANAGQLRCCPWAASPFLLLAWTWARMLFTKSLLERLVESRSSQWPAGEEGDGTPPRTPLISTGRARRVHTQVWHCSPGPFWSSHCAPRWGSSTGVSPGPSGKPGAVASVLPPSSPSPLATLSSPARCRSPRF